ncbi:palmitoyltransferase ZDHHC17-like [Lampetra fluviatilis]
MGCEHGNKEQPQRWQQEVGVDIRTWDIVKATQYGLLERCRELVEAGKDVREPDAEGISLLHWAAINNRIDVAKFYLSKGAVVNQFAGVLNATPMHWAVRQGHLEMAVLLMSFGGDPGLWDDEGGSCLHTAAQFDHPHIIAYLLAKGQDIDLLDKHGRTPIMLAALRTQGPEPTRMLVQCGASLGRVDQLHGNSVLHYAVQGGAGMPTQVLLDAGAPIDIVNKEGETPLAMAVRMKASFVARLLVEGRKTRGLHGSRLMYALKSRKSLGMVLVWLLAGLSFGLVGGVLTLNSESWLLKGTLLSAVWGSSALVTRFLFFQESQKVAQLAAFSSTMLWTHFTWFFWLWPHVGGAWSQPLAVIVSGAAFYCLAKVARPPPGIARNQQEQRQTVIKMAEAGTFTASTYCIICLAPRPPFSKHCPMCGRCIEGYDSHCWWIGNCVGAKNWRHYFGLMLSSLAWLTWLLGGCVFFWNAECGGWGPSGPDGTWNRVARITTCSPWVTWTAFNAAFHIMWLMTALSTQLYQIFVLRMTVEEYVSKKSCHHEHGTHPHMPPLHKNKEK